MRPSVRTIDCIAILDRLAPELRTTKCELHAKLLPTLKHVILTPGDNNNGGETTSRVPKGMHLYTDLIQKGAGKQQKELHERQSQLDGDTPLAVFFTSGTTGQPKAATLTNFSL
jgi:acyl-coenzyme A synthetase/AMP-(fatty) acid ligase